MIIRIGDRIINTDHYSDIYFYEDEETKPCIRGLTPNSVFLRTLYVGSKDDCMKFLKQIQAPNKFTNLK